MCLSDLFANKQSTQSQQSQQSRFFFMSSSAVSGPFRGLTAGLIRPPSPSPALHLELGDQQHPPSSSPPPYANPVSAQHERLLLELLPFRDAGAFHAWLGSDFVRGSWAEFRRDFLFSASTDTTSIPDIGFAAPEPDKLVTAQAAREAYNARKAAFVLYHPDKGGWVAQDHYVRFIVTVVADNMLRGLWTESEWKKRGVEIAKAVFEVLVFLKGTNLVEGEPLGKVD